MCPTRQGSALMGRVVPFPPAHQMFVSVVLPVERYHHPDEFAEMRDEALTLGFRHVESGPLVRSS